jgi:hypothetical protein
MKSWTTRLEIAVLLLLALMLVPPVSFAQSGGKTAGKGGRGTDGGAAVEAVSGETLQIKKLIGLGPQAIVKTPEYQTGMARGVKPPGGWAEITVVFDTALEWIDELTCQFYALAKDPDGVTFSFYRCSVRCSDIEKGRGHKVSVYLRPSVVKRCGQPIAVAVEISQGGKIIDAKSEKPGSLQKDWWKNPAVTESEKVKARDGYLLDRSQTPFALINIDDYEVTK